MTGSSGEGPVLVTGAGGQVGREVARAAAARGLEVVGLARADLDVTRADSVRSRVGARRPSTIVHCAAFTDVDGAERDPERARMVNAEGTKAVAAAAREAGAHMVYLSTDYVFDGRTHEPYSPDASPAPLSTYGRTKLEGEEAVRTAGRWTIVRTSWVFGDPERGFAAVVRRLAGGGRPLSVVEDERSRPTWAPVLAEAILDLVEAGASGIYHAACRGEATRVELAHEILGRLDARVPVRTVSAEEWGAPAPRPRYSVLDLEKTEKTLGRPFMHWRDAVKEWLT